MDPASQFLQTGLLGAIIVVLAGVIIYLYKGNQTLQSKNDSIQESRLADARETRDKLQAPLDELARNGKAVYDLLLNSNKRRS